MEIKVLASSSRGNAYWVTDGHTPILLDCGIPFPDIRKKLNFQTSDIAGALITHEHQDHCKGVSETMKAGIDCYMTQGSADAIGTVGHRVNIIKPLQQFRLGTWDIMPFDTQHDAAEPVGYLVANQAGEKLIYATDTYYIKYRFNGLTHIMLEVNHDRDLIWDNPDFPEAHKRRLMRSHMSLQVAKDFLKANDLTRIEVIYLIHLSDGNSDEARFKQEIQALTGKMILVAQA
jgi:phosphoribosyl 1,2-cyclic phosphodiesterase